MIEPAGAPIMSRDEWIGIDRPEAGTNSLCHLIDEGDAVREREVGDQDNFLQLEPVMGVFEPLFIISRSEINILAVNKKDFRDPEREIEQEKSSMADEHARAAYGRADGAACGERELAVSSSGAGGCARAGDRTARGAFSRGTGYPQS